MTGKQLRVKRAAHGIPQGTLALLADVSPTLLSQWETDTREPSADTARRVEEVLAAVIKIKTESKTPPDLRIRNVTWLREQIGNFARA